MQHLVTSVVDQHFWFRHAAKQKRTKRFMIKESENKEQVGNDQMQPESPSVKVFA